MGPIDPQIRFYKTRPIRGSLVLTLNALDLAGAEASEGSLVLGSRDARGANRALDVHNGGAHRWPTLPRWECLGLLGRHDLTEAKDNLVEQ